MGPRFRLGAPVTLRFWRELLKAVFLLLGFLLTPTALRVQSLPESKISIKKSEISNIKKSSFITWLEHLDLTTPEGVFSLKFSFFWGGLGFF